MMRSKQATREEKRASFDWCLEEALKGDYPPTETGLYPDTIYALRAVADAVAEQRPTGELVEEANRALNIELGGLPMELESLENLVASRIREQLGQGRLDKLIEAQQAVQKSLTQRIHSHGIESEETFGGATVTGGIAAELQPTQAALSGQGTLAAEVEVIRGDLVNAIRPADPELAKVVEGRNRQDAALAIELFVALVQVLQTSLTLYQVTHPTQPPAPTFKIIEIFNNTTNYFINTSPSHLSG
jgi:hypothetical protein